MRGNYHQLCAFAGDIIGGWYQQIEFELEFILYDLELAHAHAYPLVAAPGSDTRCWTDTSFEPGPKMGLRCVMAKVKFRRIDDTAEPNTDL